MGLSYQFLLQFTAGQFLGGSIAQGQYGGTHGTDLVFVHGLGQYGCNHQAVGGNHCRSFNICRGSV